MPNPINRYFLPSLAIAFCVNSAAPFAAQAAGFEILRPHRAIYEISLKDSTDRSGIDSVRGRIVYELDGNQCDGVSVKYRFVSRVNANGEIFTTDQQTASFESPDGNEYNFLTKSFVNEKLDRTVKGVASKSTSRLHVALDSPQKRKLDLPEASFITTHLVEVLERAGAGDSFFKTDVFDGGDDADEVLKTTNIIGKSRMVEGLLPGEAKEAASILEGESSWPVTIGYFDNIIKDSTEATPVYEVSFLLYEGGISRKLTMRYPDYSLTGSLVALEMFERDECSVDQ